MRLARHGAALHAAGGRAPPRAARQGHPRHRQPEARAHQRRGLEGAPSHRANGRPGKSSTSSRFPKKLSNKHPNFNSDYIYFQTYLLLTTLRLYQPSI